MTGQFQNKVALVTGGGSGFGRAIALEFAREGTSVAVVDMNDAGGKETVKLITDAGGKAIYIKTNISKAKDVEAMVAKTVETYGRLDCAINNAGVIGGRGFFHEITEEGWDAVMNVNLKGTWLSLKYEIIYMMNHGGGSIINMSSRAGLFGGDGSPYGITKAGIISMANSTAATYGKYNIRVNTICPGPAVTNIQSTTQMTPGYTPEIAKQALFKIQIPLGRMAKPEEIAAAVLWLCSDNAAYISGAVIAMDGAQSAGMVSWVL